MPTKWVRLLLMHNSYANVDILQLRNDERRYKAKAIRRSTVRQALSNSILTASPAYRIFRGTVVEVLSDCTIRAWDDQVFTEFKAVGSLNKVQHSSIRIVFGVRSTSTATEDITWALLLVLILEQNSFATSTSITPRCRSVEESSWSYRRAWIWGLELFSICLTCACLDRDANNIFSTGLCTFYWVHSVPYALRAFSAKVTRPAKGVRMRRHQLSISPVQQIPWCKLHWHLSKQTGDPHAYLYPH